MLVHTVERVHGVEKFSVARWVCRKANNQILHRLRGCYHSTRRGFEIYPPRPNGELKMLVLFSAVKADQIPHGVIESAPEIVNGIPEYQWQIERQGLIDQQLNPNLKGLPVLTLTFDNRSVWAQFNPGLDFGLEVADVLLGPI